MRMCYNRCPKTQKPMVASHAAYKLVVRLVSAYTLWWATWVSVPEAILETVVLFQDFLGGSRGGDEAQSCHRCRGRYHSMAI